MTALIPDKCLLSPSDQAAVVGGNVLTCQRIVDVVFKAFRTCAASQGCMNNITFGDESVGYYETVAGGAGAVSNASVIKSSVVYCTYSSINFHECTYIVTGSWLEWKKWHSHTYDKYKNYRS